MKKLNILSRLFKAASMAYMVFSNPRPGEESPESESRRRSLRRLTRIGAAVFFFVALGVATTALYLMFSGPLMRVQPKYVAYQAVMPPTPQGIVPVSLASAEIPPKNPLPDDDRTRATGRVYYGYYCAFCHGKEGEVTGPVGRSYMPAPTLLSLPRVQAMSDDQLYRAMLTGIGHEPVLDYVIDPQKRWYIVSYVRTLGREGP